MLTLTDRGALRRAIRDPALDAHLRAVLRLRLRQTGGEGGHFHVAGPDNAIADAEQAIGVPLTLDGEPAWEWTRRHPGGWTEVTFVLSDDGPAQVLLVPDGSLIAGLLREHAPG